MKTKFDLTQFEDKAPSMNCTVSVMTRKFEIAAGLSPECNYWTIVAFGGAQGGHGYPFCPFEPCFGLKIPFVTGIF